MERKSRFKAEGKTGDIEGSNEKEEGHYGQIRSEKLNLEVFVELSREKGLWALLLCASLPVVPYRFSFLSLPNNLPILLLPLQQKSNPIFFCLQNVGEGSQGSDNGQICRQQQGQG